MAKSNRKIWEEAAHQYREARPPQPQSKSYVGTAIGKQIDQVTSFMWSGRARGAIGLLSASRRIITLAVSDGSSHGGAKEGVVKMYGWDGNGFLVATWPANEDANQIPFIHRLDPCDAIEPMINLGLSPETIIG